VNDGHTRSALHRIVEVMQRAFASLRLEPGELQVERWAVGVHRALASRAREFHTHYHVLEMVSGVDADPLECLSALYHDVVYVQVDLGVPERFEALLKGYLSKGENGWRLLPTTDAAASDVYQVFGRKPGDVLTSGAGLNEMASALVAAKDLESVLSRSQSMAIAACIEATIPFREKVGERLAQRLTDMGVSADERQVMVERAIRLANRDVSNFAEDDPARFLDNTWKLLPETNPSLHTPEAYSVKEYRIALQKMERFLSGLLPERVFQRWGASPSPAEYNRLISNARTNIALACRYLRARLYSTAVLEAFADETGGDAPIEYFLGGFTDDAARTPKRLEQLLGDLVLQSSPLDPVLRRLLGGGRSTHTSFDISPSPLAAVLAEALGEDVVMQGFELACHMWDGGVTPKEFLREQPAPTMKALATAVGQIAETRKTALATVIP
jgi:hypothetical protein